MATQNLKRKKNNNLKDQKRTRSLNNSAIIKPFTNEHAAKWTEELSKANETLKAEIFEREQNEERLGRLNDCLLSFRADPDKNINRLVALCGEQLQATCALYNRLQGGMLHSIGQWNTPPDFISVDKPSGHICYDLIQSGLNEVHVIRNLPQTSYAQTDPNVKCYGLMTYVGKTVFFGVTCVGSLCVVYQEDYVPSEDDKKFLGIIASAIGVEEERGRAEEALQSERDKFRGMISSISDGVNIINKDYVIEFQNELLRERFGDRLGEKCYVAYMGLEKPCDFCLIHQANKTGSAVRVELVGPDGRNYELSSSPFTDVDGEAKVIELVRDITDPKRADEALRQSEEKYRTILKNIEDGYFEVNIAGNFTFFNDSLCRMLGYIKDELMGMNNRQYTDQENAKKLYQAFNKVYKTGEPEKGFDWKVIRKDGTIRFVEASVSLIKDYRGQPIGFRGIVRDITEHKQAEEVLRESERTTKRLAQENGILAEIGRIISSSLNIDEVYERLDEEVRKLIPFDRIVININNFENNTITIAYASGIEVPGRRVGDVIPLNGSVNQEIIHTRSSLLIQSEDMAEFINRFPTLRPYLQVGLVSMMMIPLISRDQVIGVLHFRLIKQNTYTEEHMKLAERVSSQIASAIANAQLFNERKKIERALQESESRFKNLFDEAPVGYHEYNTEGLITQVNRTELEMLGYTVEEMLGQPIWQFITEIRKSRETVIAKLSGEIPPGRQFERSFQRKDGTTFPTLIEDRVLRDSEGKITGIRSTIQDITERKRTEEEMVSLQEQLRQSQKIEAIGQLAGGIAHDFNNLLTVIKGYSQLSLIELKEGDPLRSNIKEIQNASERAANLTRQILAFSRRQVLDIKVLDLNSILRDLDKMLRRVIGEDIELVTLLADHLGRVKTDPGQIEQVIMNIAVNARDAMPSGGKLTIETGNVELDEAYARRHIAVIPGRHVMLSVSDTGVGMTPELRDRVFEPFFTTKEKGKGTGLGLSMVYGIVKQSEGNIWVYSEPGHGTTLKIYLPRVEEDLDTLHGRDETEFSPRGSETVLLVEDEQEVRLLAHRLLSQQGYRVLEAANGEEALRVVQEHIGEKIHLLLTDVVMPQMGGKELANQLKNLRPDVKVLYTSGYTDDAIVHNGVLEPGTHFLQKPFSLKTLSQKVREVLDR